MKRLKLASYLLVGILLLGCDSSSKYLEVYFGVNSNVSEITDKTFFPFAGEEPITFDVGANIVIRLDFLMLSGKDKEDESLTVDLSYPNVSNVFLDAVNGTMAESSQTDDIFTYHLVVVPDAYSSFYFSIETSSPVVFSLEISAPFNMKQVDQNPLNQTSEATSEEYRVVSAGKVIQLTQLNFI